MFNLPHLDALRKAEISKVLQYLSPGMKLLEIGAGTGRQAIELANAGFYVEAVELRSTEIDSSQYAEGRVFPIVDYDGRHIPFPDHSFDIVFSSNVLEHVRDLVYMHGEIRRVLKCDGYAVHVLPTHAWRLWTLISSVPTTFQYAAD